MTKTKATKASRQGKKTKSLKKNTGKNVVSSSKFASSFAKKAAEEKKAPAKTANATSFNPLKSLTDFKPSKKTLVVTAIITLLLVVIYFGKNLLLVGFVNGQPISRLDIIRRLEKSQAQAMVEQVVNEMLVLQEAKKQGIVIDQKVIDEEIAKIEENLTAQGQSLDSILALQGMTREDLVKNLKIQKIIEQALSSQQEVSQEEIDAYIEANKDFLPTDASEEAIRSMAVENLQQQRLRTQFQEWLQGLKDSAKIKYFVNYGQEEQVQPQVQVQQ